MGLIGPLAEGTTARQTGDGLEVTETYLVTSVRGSKTTRIVNALREAGLPQYGDRHASDATISVDSMAATPASGDPEKILVAVTYRRPTVDSSDIGGGDDSTDGDDPGVLEVWSTGTQQQTQFDHRGVQIFTTHAYTSGERAGQTVTQGGTVEVYIPQVGIRLTRVERSNPLPAAGQMVGRINAASWNGYPRHAVLCVGVDGRTSDGGQTYEVTYTFAVDQDGWNARLIYVDPDTGEVPIDVVPGLGYKSVQVYQEADYGKLNIDLTRGRRATGGLGSPFRVEPFFLAWSGA